VGWCPRQSKARAKAANHVIARACASADGARTPGCPSARAVVRQIGESFCLSKIDSPGFRGTLRPGRYRIFLRQMFTSAAAGMSYCDVMLTASTATPGTQAVPSLGILHGNLTPGCWQTVSSEGMFQVPAGQTVQLNVGLQSYGGTCQLANSTSDSSQYTNVTAWPL
jgi:hypothetical protein